MTYEIEEDALESLNKVAKKAVQQALKEYIGRLEPYHLIYLPEPLSFALVLEDELGVVFKFNIAEAIADAAVEWAEDEDAETAERWASRFEEMASIIRAAK